MRALTAFALFILREFPSKALFYNFFSHLARSPISPSMPSSSVIYNLYGHYRGDLHVSVYFVGITNGNFSKFRRQKKEERKGSIEGLNENEDDLF